VSKAGWLWRFDAALLLLRHAGLRDDASDGGIGDL
jgi:hypothetical protein